MVNEMSTHSIIAQKTNIAIIVFSSSCKISNMDSIIGMSNNASMIKKEIDGNFNILDQP